MTIAIEDTVYTWQKSTPMVFMVTDQGACVLEISIDGLPFAPVAELPDSDGNYAAQAQIQNCQFKFTGISGTVGFKPNKQ